MSFVMKYHNQNINNKLHIITDILGYTIKVREIAFR